MVRRLTSLELCAGSGGLALGLETAGFDPVVLVDELGVACGTLRVNRPYWDVKQMDVRDFTPALFPELYGVDLLSAGLPRLKATASNLRTRGAGSEIELVKATLSIASKVRARGVLIDNVPDIVTAEKYSQLRNFIRHELEDLGYKCQFFVLNAADFGLPQDRKHGFLLALDSVAVVRFRIPVPSPHPRVTVGEALVASMQSAGWNDAGRWAEQARITAPTLVGGSWDRGGADLGPTGTKRAWARIGVDGATLGDTVPGIDFEWAPQTGRHGMVRLTVDQTAILQGFPSDWHVSGGKTAQYRQIANAVPPPLAFALGKSIASAMRV